MTRGTRIAVGLRACGSERQTAGRRRGLQASLALIRDAHEVGFRHGVWLTQSMVFNVWEEEGCGRCGEGWNR